MIERIVGAFQASTAGLTYSASSVRVETKLLSEEMAKVEGEHAQLRDDLGIEFGQQTATIKSVREEMSKWASDYKVTIMTMLQQGGRGSGPRGAGGPLRGAEGKGPTIDKKELSVWKLSDQVTKHEFR